MLTKIIGQTALNRVGYTPEISHGVLVEMAEHRKELEKKTKPILDTLRSYQDLPPVIPHSSERSHTTVCNCSSPHLLVMQSSGLCFCFCRTELWLLWLLRTRKGSLLLLRSTLKMCCNQLLPQLIDTLICNFMSLHVIICPLRRATCY